LSEQVDQHYPSIAGDAYRQLVWKVLRDLSTARTIANGHCTASPGALQIDETYTNRVLDKELSHSWMVYYYSTENGIDIRDDRLRPASAFEERELVIRLISVPELKYPVELKVKLGLGYVMNHEDRLVTVLAEPM
jgi:hypothetical protein